MSNGVQYNISFNDGGGKNELQQLIALMQSSVGNTVRLQTAISSLNSSAVTAIGGVESAVKDLSGNLNNKLNPVVRETGTDFDTAGNKANTFAGRIEKLGKASFYLNNLRQAIGGVANDFNDAMQPGLAYNDMLKDMQAITGSTDADANALGETAIKQSKVWGVDATRGLESYKILLSKLGPELNSTPAALTKMGEDAVILSKQLGGDVGGATELLTTAMNQFGISIKDPIQATKTMGAMMNIMSAAAQEGSAELPEIKSALEQSGMMAKVANVSFAELNSSIQLLDKAGKKGAEGGVALRNAFAIMGEGPLMHQRAFKALTAAGVDVQALGDKTKTFEERLGYLKPVMNNVAVMTAVFGRENVGAGLALVQNASAIGEMTNKIVGTNSAMDMANIKMESQAEQMKKWQAKIDAVKISFFNVAGSMTPFISMGMGALQVLANLSLASTLFSGSFITKLLPAIGAGLVSLGSWIAEMTMATLAQLGLNAAMSMNPIGAIVIAVAAAVAAIVLLVKYWHVIWDAIKSFSIWVWEHSPFKFLIDVTDRIFPGFKKQMAALWDWIVGKFEALIGWFKKAWDWIKKLFGGGKDAASDASKSAVDEYKKQLNQPIAGITVAAAGVNSPVVNFKRGHSRGDGSGTGSTTASNTTSGGSRPTTINITIQKLQDQIVIKTVNLKEGAKEAADKVVNELLMALNSVDSKSGGVAYGN